MDYKESNYHFNFKRCNAIVITPLPPQPHTSQIKSTPQKTLFLKKNLQLFMETKMIAQTRSLTMLGIIKLPYALL